MNWEAISAISEIVGAVVVVATLIYLAIQVRQNTNAMQATSREAVSRETIDFMMQISSNEEAADFWFRALTGSTDLAPSARLRRDMLAYAAAEIFEMAYMQWRRGVLSDSDWEKWNRIIASYLEMPGFREFWETGGVNLGSGFREYVNQITLDATYDFSQSGP